MEKKILNLEEVSAYTGYSKAWLYKLTSRRILPHSKPNGKKLYFLREDVDSFLLSNRISTRQEIQQEALSIINRRSRT